MKLSRIYVLLIQYFDYLIKFVFLAYTVLRQK